jgi:hypothetical protein
MRWGYDKWPVADQQSVAEGLGYTVEQLRKQLSKERKPNDKKLIRKTDCRKGK